MDNKAFKSSESSDYLEGKYRPTPNDSAVRDLNSRVPNSRLVS